MSIPFLITDNPKINRAYRLATATLSANILPFKDGLLEREEPVIIAGLGYSTPWVRDTSINTANAGALLFPKEAKNTLLAVLNRDEDGCFIDGEYWDSIIWACGAWQYYILWGDTEFLHLAYTAIENSLAFFEKTEFSEKLGLFRGGACYGDGIAAYPDHWAKHGQSGIIHSARHYADLISDRGAGFVKDCRKLSTNDGVGLPIYTLSTNCLYYQVYIIADKMAKILEKEQRHAKQAENIKNAINRIFWNSEKGSYNYIFDEFGGCDYQEGLGISFAILFGIANKEQTESIFENYKTTPHGIPCVYPSFARYKRTPDDYGRHSGTVWPHIQGFWADAAAKNGRTDIFETEFLLQTENALRYNQFAELYHPTSGEMYGGLQENGEKGIGEWWGSEPFQTWSATAYLRDVYRDICGITFTLDGISFTPVGTSLTSKTELRTLRYKNAVINLTITGNGDKITAFKINGKDCAPFLPADSRGTFDIEITL